MARYTRGTLTGTNAPVNTETQKIEQAINDTLSRKGDQPNSMEAPLDMNSNRVLNLPAPIGDTEPLRNIDGKQYVTAAAASAAEAKASEEAAELSQIAAAGSAVSAAESAAAAAQFPEGQLSIALAQEGDEKGADLIADVSFVRSHLKEFATTPMVDGRRYTNAGFYTGTTVGGGDWVYDASRPKTDHNVGTVVDPDRLAVWDGTQGDLSTLYTAAVSGVGCLVRVHSIPLSSPELNASWFGLIEGDPVNDGSIPINKAVSMGLPVYIDEGSFYINDTIKGDFVGAKIIGAGRDITTITNQNGSVPAIDNSQVLYIQGITVNCNAATRTASNILAKSRIIATDVISTGAGGYGIEFSDSHNIVAAKLNMVTCTYNTAGGIRCIAAPNFQKNNIEFNFVYCVKNGTDADNLSSNATPTSGHGFLIRGGIGISFNTCVAEYNTGAGLLLDKTTGYTLNGFTSAAFYFEQNKYANILVDYNNENWRNVFIKGSAFNSVTSYPANSLVPVQGDIAFLDRNPFVKNNDVQIENIRYLLTAYGESAALKRTLKPDETFELGYDPYQGDRVVSNHPNGDGYNTVVINQELGGLAEINKVNYAPVTPFASYMVEIDYKSFRDGSGSAAFLIVNQLNKDGGAISGATQLSQSLPESTTDYLTVRYLFDKANLHKDCRFLKFTYSATAGIPTAGWYFLIRKGTVKPIDFECDPTGTTAARPSTGTSVKGMRYFDETLNKPIWFNGTSWVDATGATV